MAKQHSDKQLVNEAVAIVRRLHQAGHQAYFAGGCVRDRLLGIEPGDYDTATSATPEQVMELFARTVAVGVQFGVVRVMVDKLQFEVATFRADGKYLDGRRPEKVEFTSAENDARRRDFTINGMFYDPLNDQVIDYVGGRNDLEQQLIRAIGDPVARFSEDYLRLLRAVRFAARFGFKTEPATYQALQQHAPSIQRVSPERIRDELVKILCHPSRADGLDLLDQSGLLREILPEVAALKGCEQPPQFHPEGDVYVHTRIMLQELPEHVSQELALAVLLHDIGKPETYAVDESGRIRFNGHDRVGARMSASIMKRLKFSNHAIEQVVEMVRQHMTFKDVTRMRTAKLKRFMARPTFTEELELHRVDCLSSHGMLDNYDFLLEKSDEFANEPLIPPPLVGGDDLIALGLEPSPQFSKILDTVQSMQLEGELTSREEALAYIRKYAL